MNDVAGSNSLIDLSELLEYLRRRLMLIVSCTLIGFAAALVFLNFATPKYVANLRVTPAGMSASGAASAIGRLGSLAAAAGLTSRQANEGASPFELFLEALRSRAVADALMQDNRIARTLFEREWNSTADRWEERPGLLRPVRNGLYWLAGQNPPVWAPPDGERLQELLQRVLTISPPKAKDPPITVISVTHKDRTFATYFLSQLVATADTHVRDVTLQRAQIYARQLSDRLRTTDVPEHRKTLSDALLEQERSIMMATGRGAFAALQVEPALSSPRPVSPRIVQSLMVGALIGLCLCLFGLILAFLFTPAARRAS
jgi:LPS O-antigen subunit length determinant protein (WzzB/FepE family)